MIYIARALRHVESLHVAARAAQLHPIAALSRHQFPLRKLQAGIRTFDDVLLTVHRAVHGNGSTSPLVTALRKRLKAAIVDECQDSDQIQIEVFRGLFAQADSFSNWRSQAKHLSFSRGRYCKDITFGPQCQAGRRTKDQL